MVDKVDILGHLPWAFRMIIKAFIARPFHYQVLHLHTIPIFGHYSDVKHQWFDEAVAKVTIGGETTEIKGKALHEVTFVNPE